MKYIYIFYIYQKGKIYREGLTPVYKSSYYDKWYRVSESIAQSIVIFK